MKLRNLVILLSFVLVCTQSKQPSHESMIERLSIRRSNQNWMLKLTCNKLSNPCSFKYTDIPYPWVQKRQTLYVPLDSLHQQQQFCVQVKVRNWKGVEALEEVKIKISPHKVVLVSKGRVKDEENHLSAVPIKQYNSKSNKVVSNLNLKNKQQLTWMQRYGLDPYLPTIPFLQEILSSRDSQTISKTLKNIIVDGSPCQNKLSYLQKVQRQVSNLIQTTMKKLQLEKKINQKSQKQIQILLQQKEHLKEQLKKQNQKPFQQQRQLILEKQIDSLQSQKVSMNVVANKYLERLQLLHDQINNTATQQIKQKISYDEIELKQIQAERQILEKKQKSIQKRILQNKNIIKNEQIKNQEKFGQIIILQKKYNIYTQKAKQLEKKQLDAKSKLQYVKSMPRASSGGNSEQILQRIKVIDEALMTKKTKTNSTSQVKPILDILLKNKPQLQKAIKKCKNPSPPKRQQKYETFDLFSSYASFGEDKSSEKEIPPVQTFHHLYSSLQKIKIFSNSWVMKHGIPVVYHFNCDQAKSRKSGYGIIKEIVKGTIKIKDQEGLSYSLYLGGCTELEGVGQYFIPQKGDLIEWKGQMLVRGVVNLHNAKIYRKLE